MTPPTTGGIDPVARDHAVPRRFGPNGPDLSALPIAGITQRRVAIVLGALIAAWIVLLFARQVGEASAASGRAEAMISENAVRHAEIAGLERELDRIQQRRFILQQARAHGLGGAHRDRVHARQRTRRPCRPTRLARPRLRRRSADAASARSSRWLTLAVRRRTTDRAGHSSPYTLVAATVRPLSLSTRRLAAGTVT